MKNFKNYSGSSLDDKGLEPNIERNVFCEYVFNKYHFDFLGLVTKKLARNFTNRIIMAEEVTQIFYQRLLSHYQTAHNGYQTYGKNYLKKILYNVYYDYLKTQKNNREESELVIELYHNQVTKEITMDIEQIMIKIENILNTLKPNHAEIFREYLDGIPQALIAERLNRPRGTINSIISRTRNMIRKKVKP